MEFDVGKAGRLSLKRDAKEWSRRVWDRCWNPNCEKELGDKPILDFFTVIIETKTYRVCPYCFKHKELSCWWMG